MTSPPLAVTVDGLAEMLGISRASVYRRIKDGTIPSVLIGNCRRIFLADLEQLRAAPDATMTERDERPALHAGRPSSTTNALPAEGVGDPRG
jgi:excisionase family DNA binding protein